MNQTIAQLILIVVVAVGAHVVIALVDRSVRKDHQKKLAQKARYAIMEAIKDGNFLRFVSARAKKNTKALGDLIVLQTLLAVAYQTAKEGCGDDELEVIEMALREKFPNFVEDIPLVVC